MMNRFNFRNLIRRSNSSRNANQRSNNQRNNNQMNFRTEINNNTRSLDRINLSSNTPKNNIQNEQKSTFDLGKINEICLRNIDNRCEFGDKCRYVHGIKCEKCNKNIFNPFKPYALQKLEHEKVCKGENSKLNSEENNENDNKENIKINKEENINKETNNNDTKTKNDEIKKEKNSVENKNENKNETKNENENENTNISNINSNENKSKENEENEETEYICTICLEEIKPPTKFGVLSKCKHYFCYDCITIWRNFHGVDEINNHLKCPLCKIKSQFVIPSETFPKNDEEHERLIKEHKQYLSNIECKKLKENKYKFCPYGDDCLYSHYGPDGTYIIFNNGNSRSEPICPEEYDNYNNQNYMYIYGNNYVEEIMLVDDGDDYGMHNGVFINPIYEYDHNDYNEDDSLEISEFDLINRSNNDGGHFMERRNRQNNENDMNDFNILQEYRNYVENYSSNNNDQYQSIFEEIDNVIGGDDPTNYEYEFDISDVDEENVVVDGEMGDDSVRNYYSHPRDISSSIHVNTNSQQQQQHPYNHSPEVFAYMPPNINIDNSEALDEQPNGLYSRHPQIVFNDDDDDEFTSGNSNYSNFYHPNILNNNINGSNIRNYHSRSRSGRLLRPISYDQLIDRNRNNSNDDSYERIINQHPRYSLYSPENNSSGNNEVNRIDQLYRQHIQNSLNNNNENENGNGIDEIINNFDELYIEENEDNGSIIYY